MAWTTLQAQGEARAIDPVEVHRALEVLVDPTGQVELRGLPGGIVRRSPGKDLVNLVVQADELARAGCAGVYYVMNPLRADLKANENANASAIVKRRWLLIDIDPCKPEAHKDDSASEEERKGATGLAGEVVSYLATLGWPEPLQIDSGGGMHLLYRVDLPADEESRTAIRALLLRLSKLFTIGGKIDPKVFDAPRIAKLPGTWAKRGRDTADRPHRMARIVHIPPRFGRVSLEQIQTAAVPIEPKAETNGVDYGSLPSSLIPDEPIVVPTTPSASVWIQTASGGEAERDVWDRAVDYVNACGPAIQRQDGSGKCMSVARGVVWGFGLGQQVGFDLLWAHYNPRCLPPWSEKELRHKCHDAEMTPDPKNRPRCYLLEQSRAGASSAELAEEATSVGPVNGWQWLPISTEELLAAPKPEWLVENILAAGQPAVMGGPLKAFKTSVALDLAVSLASVTPFLGKFIVPRRRQVAVISGESGQWTIGQTVRRVCAGRGIDPVDLNIKWMFDLPLMTSQTSMDRLCEGLKRDSVEVLFLDPLYLCLLGGKTEVKASDLYQIGPLLLRVARACLAAGVTLILLHHSGKPFARSFDPPELTDLAFAGIGEFARQWLLLGWRERYNPEGVRKLWFSASGSIGHGGLWAIDVQEGSLDADFGGRAWEVVVTPASEEIEVRQEQARDVRSEQAGQKAAIEEQKVLDTLDHLLRDETGRDGVSLKDIRAHAKMGTDKVEMAISRLLDMGRIEEIVGFTKQIGNGAKRPCRGFRNAK